MELKDLFRLRRSIRKYDENATIDEEVIRQIITDTLLAPSWKNSETGRYYVAVSKEAIEAVKEALPDFNVKNTDGCSAYIVPTFVKDISGCGQTNGVFINELTNEWGAYDLGLQNSYMILKASDLGYDTLIMGMRDSQKLREYFGIGEEEMVGPVIAIGKRKEEGIIRKRKELEEVLKIK